MRHGGMAHWVTGMDPIIIIIIQGLSDDCKESDPVETI